MLENYFGDYKILAKTPKNAPQNSSFYSKSLFKRIIPCNVWKKNTPLKFFVFERATMCAPIAFYNHKPMVLSL